MKWLPEGSFGHNLTVQSSDPEVAKTLLAEAGYLEGFRVTIITPNDARLSQAVAQIGTRIGVRTAADAMPYAAFVPRRTRREFLLQMAAWGQFHRRGHQLPDLDHRHLAGRS